MVSFYVRALFCSNAVFTFSRVLCSLERHPSLSADLLTLLKMYLLVNVLYVICLCVQLLIAAVVFLKSLEALSFGQGTVRYCNMLVCILCGNTLDVWNEEFPHTIVVLTSSSSLFDRSII